MTIRWGFFAALFLVGLGSTSPALAGPAAWLLFDDAEAAANRVVDRGMREMNANVITAGEQARLAIRELKSAAIEVEYQVNIDLQRRIEQVLQGVLDLEKGLIRDTRSLLHEAAQLACEIPLKEDRAVFWAYHPPMYSPLQHDVALELEGKFCGDVNDWTISAEYDGRTVEARREGTGRIVLTLPLSQVVALDAVTAQSVKVTLNEGSAWYQFGKTASDDFEFRIFRAPAQLGEITVLLEPDPRAPSQRNSHVFFEAFSFSLGAGDERHFDVSDERRAKILYRPFYLQPGAPPLRTGDSYIDPVKRDGVLVVSAAGRHDRKRLEPIRTKPPRSCDFSAATIRGVKANYNGSPSKIGEVHCQVEENVSEIEVTFDLTIGTDAPSDRDVQVGVSIESGGATCWAPDKPIRIRGGANYSAAPRSVTCRSEPGEARLTIFQTTCDSGHPPTNVACTPVLNFSRLLVRPVAPSGPVADGKPQ